MEGGGRAKVPPLPPTLSVPGAAIIKVPVRVQQGRGEEPELE